MTLSQPQPWQIQSSEILADCRIFKVRKDVVISPRTGQPHDMFVLEQPNWVNVIPLTPDEHQRLEELWGDNFGVTNRYEMPLKSSTGG